MPATFIPVDAVAVVPVAFTDQVGRPVSSPAEATFSAASGLVSLAWDGTHLTITPTGADGSDTITATWAGGSAAFEVETGAPSAVSAVLGEPTFTTR